jgi:hypothetical protein
VKLLRWFHSFTVRESSSKRRQNACAVAPRLFAPLLG